MGNGLEFDDSDFQKNLRKLEARLPHAVSDATENAANELLRLSQIEVPHDEGTLQNTGKVEQAGNDWVVGYNTVYAARLHEHPEYRFQKGRKGKYLEDPLMRNLQVLGIRWSKNVQIKLLVKS